METLEYCAKNSFRDTFVSFEDEADPAVLPVRGAHHENESKPEACFETVRIRHGITRKQRADSSEHLAFYERSERTASQLVHFFSKQDLGEIVPELKLIGIQSDYPPGTVGSAGAFSLGITRSIFDLLLDKMQANAWVLWLLSNKYDGFHYMKARKPGQIETYFFGFYYCAVAWTFDPVTACTRVLYVARQRFQDDSFYELIQTYMSQMFTPYVPLMAFTLMTMLKYDERLDLYLRDIIDVEQCTGFSSVPRAMPGAFEVDSLTEWSRLSSNAQINIINLSRHHDSCLRALETIPASYNRGDLRCPNTQYKDSWDRSILDILDSIAVLKMRADSFTPYAAYLKNRAEAQISVIFALLTHEDSISNLKAAEASMAIAEAAKRDSSAMKTIAVMTMVFLPATFLATVFALPVMEWDIKREIQIDGFKLYWAVTIPSTIVVFVVWALVTQRNWILNEILKHRKIDKESKKDC